MHKYCFIKNTASNDTHIWGLTLAWSGCWRSNSVLQSNKKTEIQAMPKQLSTFREWGLGAGVGRRWRRGRRDPRVSLDQPKWDDHSPWANLTHFERHCQGCFPRRRPAAADYRPGRGWSHRRSWLGADCGRKSPRIQALQTYRLLWELGADCGQTAASGSFPFNLLSYIFQMAWEWKPLT